MHSPKKCNCNLIALILTFLFKGALHLNDYAFAYFIETASDQTHQAS